MMKVNLTQIKKQNLNDGTISTGLQTLTEVENFSTYKKIVRVIAYVLRFVHNSKRINKEKHIR